MARGQKTGNQLIIPQSYNAMDQFKVEVASELGINPEYKSGYWGNIPARECGAVGGHMVRRMIAAAEQSLIEQTAANVKAGFRTSFGLEPDAARTGTSSAHNLREQQGVGLGQQQQF